MARQTYFGSWQSFAGAALIAAGVLGLYGELHTAAVHLSVVPASLHSKQSALLPAALFAISKLSMGCIFGHFHVMAALARHLALSSWPLLLVITGALLPDGRSGRRERSKKLLVHCRSGATPFDVQVETRCR